MRHGLKDGQAEALPDRREGEDARTRVGARQVDVVESAEDVDPLGRQGCVRRVRTPPGRSNQDEVEVGAAQLLVGRQEGGQILARLARADPQDVGAGQAVAGAELLHLCLRDGRMTQAVRDDGDARGIQAGLNTVVGGGLRRDDDGIRALLRDLEGAVKIGGTVGREVVGVAQEGDVVDGDGQGTRGRRDRPGRRVHDVGSPARSDAEYPVHAGHTQAVPGGVERAPRQ